MKIGHHWNMWSQFAQDKRQFLITFQIHVRQKTSIIERQTLDTILTQRPWRLDLFPGSIGMAPESGDPTAIEFLQRAVALAKPLAETRGAMITITGWPILIADVPE